MKKIKKLCAGIVLSFVVMGSIPATASELQGVYRQRVTVTQDGMMFDRGDKLMSELIIIGETDKNLELFMNMGHEAGVACSMENGGIINHPDNSFSVIAVDSLFHEECELEFMDIGGKLQITDEINCDAFCGFGAKFEGATFEKVCDQSSQAAVDHLTDLFFVSEDNVRACN